MLTEILTNSFDVVIEAAPYIILGTFFAGIIQAYMNAESVKKHLSEPSFKSVFRASLIGVPLPLCSCSVLPVAMQIRKSGANRGATSSFLISTPQTGVDSVMLSIGLLNPIFAVARIIGAFTTGFLAGSIQNLFERAGDPGEPLAMQSSCCSGSSCCGPKQQNAEKNGFIPRFLSGQHYAFGDLLPSMSGYYVLGILLTGVVMTFLPDGFLEEYLGGGLLGMIVVSFVGLVVYICASGATPLVAVLVAKGMSPGTALVLLLAGPATSLASLVAVRAMLGTRGLILYLGTIIITAIGLGLGFDWFYTFSGIPVLLGEAVSGEGHVHHSPFLIAFAAIASIFMVYWAMKPWVLKLWPKSRSQPPPRETAAHS